MVELLDEIRADKSLSTAARWEDGNKIRDGIMIRAPEAMIKYGSQWKVTPDALKDKTVEMTNAAGESSYIIPSKAQDYSYIVKSTTPEPPNILLSRSNLISTTCTVSTVQFSIMPFSIERGSATKINAVCWNGKDV